MIGKLRRILNLYRLLWVEDRMVALEDKLVRSQQRIENQKNQIIRLQNQVTGRFERADEKLDLLKSSLEVPPETVGEFHEWKARNPLPERPLVSVTVATYNRARLLTERCIPSVLGQTYENLELIVVGDGCTDDTEEAVAGIADPRLQFVNLPERDSYPADPKRRWMVAGTRPTNKAFAMVGGDFVSHLDDDDEYHPERLEKLVEFVLTNDCDFVWHPFWWGNEDGSWTLNEAERFAHSQVTNASVFYRSWFLRFDSNPDSYLLMEPGDWNRFRRIKYVNPVCMRYPEPLLRKYVEVRRD